MRVKATAKAFYGGSRVRPGDVIVVPDDFKASWAEPVVVPVKETVKKKSKAKKKASKKAAG